MSFVEKHRARSTKEEEQMNSFAMTWNYFHTDFFISIFGPSVCHSPKCKHQRVYNGEWMNNMPLTGRCRVVAMTTIGNQKLFALCVVRGVCTLISDYFTYQVQHHFDVSTFVVSQQTHNTLPKWNFRIRSRVCPLTQWVSVRLAKMNLCMSYTVVFISLPIALTAPICYTLFDSSFVCSIALFQLFNCSCFVSVSVQHWNLFRWKITEPQHLLRTIFSPSHSFSLLFFSILFHSINLNLCTRTFDSTHCVCTAHTSTNKIIKWNYIFLNAFTTQRLQQYFFRVFHFSFVFGLRNSLFKGDLYIYMKWKFGSITKQEPSKSLIARISLIEVCHLVFVFRCCIFTDFPCYDVQQTRNKQIENASLRWWAANVDECFNTQNW